MYKLVIVEDERDARKRLISMIEKAGSKFELIAEYENGIDAYDGILSDSPDLVITDIRIPYINGIELAKKIREMLPLVKIIINTGFNEFDYAKEAANLGVLGFISKPVTQEDVDTLLKKVEETLDEEFLSAENLTKLETFYENNLPIIREHDLYRLSGMSAISPAFRRKLRHNNIDLDYRYFAMCVFDFDEALDGNMERYEFGLSSVRKLVSESFGGLCDVEMFSRDEKLCLILKSNDSIDISKAENLMETIILRVGRFSGMPLSVGMSNIYEGDLDFSGMLREALRALEYRGVMGGRKVFFFGNAAPAPAGKILIDDTDIRQLGYLMRYKPVEECIECLAVIRQKMETDEAQNSYYYLLTSILNTLIKSCDDLEGLYTRYSGQGGMYRRLFESKTADEVFAFFSEMTRVIRTLNDNIIVDNVENNLQKVLDYMETHYSDADISFESVAREVNFSVSYISALLKKNRNTSFIKHLTALRMEKAKELLKSPALKIIDIAEQLGYADPYYFSHCFKKYTGFSPKEFRNHE